MYDRDNPVIARAMLDDPLVFKRGVLFTIASVQQQFYTLPKALADIERRGEQSHFLFGWKRESYRWLEANYFTLWQSVKDERVLSVALDRVCQMPGLGLVKGAFVLQLMGRDIACFDGNNLRRYGLDRDTWQLHGVKHGPAYERKRYAYIRDAGGRARQFWDEWCQYVGDKYGRSADHISRLHVDLIVGRGLTAQAPALDDTDKSGTVVNVPFQKANTQETTDLGSAPF